MGPNHGLPADEQIRILYAGSIAAAFIIFILVQYINGSGPIAALVFGIILAKGRQYTKR
jgi:hypothetical protein